MKKILSWSLIIAIIASCASPMKQKIKASKKRSVQHNKIQYRGTKKR